jgi:predicted PilT family ATPase
MFYEKLIVINKTSIGHIIGKGGERINEIKSRFLEEDELEISIPNKNKQKQNDSETVDCKVKAKNENTVEKCSKVLALLNEKLLITSVGIQSFINKCFFEIKNERLHEEVFSVPKKYFCILIGKKGINVKIINQKYDVKISFDEYNDTVTINGKFYDCFCAKDDLCARLKVYTEVLTVPCELKVMIPKKYIIYLGEKYNVKINSNNRNEFIISGVSARDCALAKKNLNGQLRELVISRNEVEFNIRLGGNVNKTDFWNRKKKNRKKEWCETCEGSI